MNKTPLKPQGEPEEVKDTSGPILTTWKKVNSVGKLDELVTKHGTVFLVNPKGLPLKVQRAELK